MDAIRDQNRVAVLMGLDASGVMQAAKVDGVTGRLFIQPAGSASPSAQAFSIAKRDANRVTNALCVETDGTIQGILVDSDRNLYVAES